MPPTIPSELSEVLKAVLLQPRPLTELEQFELEEKREKMAAAKLEREIKAQQYMEQALSEREKMQAHLAGQKSCTHTHRDGKSRCVFVHDDLGGYIICLKCQAIIRPESKFHVLSTSIYDTALFSRLMQESSTTGIND